MNGGEDDFQVKKISLEADKNRIDEMI